ncbi:MAG: hypothetical protein NWE93_05795 [Candidatus Bathyarchaeota archaeon]|nr:hypothetical protein [Candidatus Bathyarchaeota archaeon]
MSGLDRLLLRMMRVFRRLPINPLSIGSQKAVFLDYFKGFDEVASVKAIFGEKTTQVLGHLKVELSWLKGYMYVDGEDGHIVISKGYLDSGDRKHIYLDLIHELCHVKQFMDGRELFDPHYSYVDRPTEIEAYRYTVEEAKRLGMGEKQIRAYLKTEWMSDQDLEKLVKNIGLQKT